jgi:hypothetical protein
MDSILKSLDESPFQNNFVRQFEMTDRMSGPLPKVSMNPFESIIGHSKTSVALRKVQNKPIDTRFRFLVEKCRKKLLHNPLAPPKIYIDDLYKRLGALLANR